MQLIEELLIELIEERTSLKGHRSVPDPAAFLLIGHMCMGSLTRTCVSG